MSSESCHFEQGEKSAFGESCEKQISHCVRNDEAGVRNDEAGVRNDEAGIRNDEDTGDSGGIRIAVLVSGAGRGSNMQAIIDACRSGQINGEVALVIGVKDDAPAMERARSQGVKTLAISPKSFESDDAYNNAVFAALKEDSIDLICLAGYMRVLGQNIVDEYRNRIMNVHPALLPAFGGKGMYGHHVHEAVIARGVKFTGATVHLVDEEYDSGPIVLQAIVPVEDDDTPDTVAARVLTQEHRIYAEAVALYSQGKLKVEGRKVRILPE